MYSRTTDKFAKSSLPPAPQRQETVGSRLRARRESLGESIDNVVRETRLSRQIIEALEADDRDSLSSDFYTRGFLKIYARYLEFDPAVVLDAYERQSTMSRLLESGEADGDGEVPNYFRAQPVATSSRGLSPSQIFLLVMTILVVVGFMLSVNKSNKSAPAVAERPAVAAPGTPATATTGGKIPGVVPKQADGAVR